MPGIIKHTEHSAERSSVGAVAFNFDDMTGKAGAYLAQVKADAAAEIARAKEEAVRIKKQAQQDGTRAAIEAAEKSVQFRVEAQVREQMKTVLPAIQEAVESLKAARHEWLQQWEHNAVKLATAISAKIIRREISRQPDIALALVREALELAAGGHVIRISISPADHSALGKEVEQLAQQLTGLAPTAIVADDSISPGGCLVQTEFGAIDQRIESQLARIEEELS
jgi:flagellar biosynthesis/type III secretory pathway protein FliH